MIFCNILMKQIGLVEASSEGAKKHNFFLGGGLLLYGYLLKNSLNNNI